MKYTVIFENYNQKVAVTGDSLLQLQIKNDDVECSIDLSKSEASMIASALIEWIEESGHNQPFSEGQIERMKKLIRQAWSTGLSAMGEACEVTDGNGIDTSAKASDEKLEHFIKLNLPMSK